MLTHFSLFSTASKTWIGARFNGTMYHWESTSASAMFLRALSIDRTAGDCLVLASAGLEAADCLSLNYVLCQKGKAMNCLSILFFRVSVISLVCYGFEEIRFNILILYKGTFCFEIFFSYFSEPSPCPLGQQLGQKGHCFYLETTEATWNNSRTTCQSQYNGDLAVFDDASDAASVLSALGLTG